MPNPTATPLSTTVANQLIRDLNPLFQEIASQIESWRTTTAGEFRHAEPVDVAALRETLGAMIENGRDVVAILTRIAIRAERR